MKIGTYQIFPLSVPLDKPIETSFGTMKYRNGCLLRLETAEGMIGWGESWINYPGWGLQERMATLTAVCEVLLELGSTEPRRVYQQLVQRFALVARQWGAIGPIAQSISAVDLALWDITAKAAGRPVYGLFKKNPKPISVYASGIGPYDVAGFLSRAKAAGFTAAKIKVGFGEEIDLNNLLDARRVWGEQTLMLDANQGWSLGQALGMVQKLESFQPYWLEEPLPADDLTGVMKLAHSTTIPLALGENLYGQGFVDFISTGAIHFIQPDLAKAGGLSAALEVTDKAVEHNVTALPHIFGTALSNVVGAHYAAIVDAPWLEFDANPNPLREHLLEEPLVIRNGKFLVPESAGWGVTINQQFLKEYAFNG
ncbi:mandelate racemase/muconate lactonizing enzyme family protein [Desulforamulus ruminis]|uniref:mandelate racemase/muconate lactonizing enzyme family protein n=1 Tax=Desulforamulus ruminis TaxID=1564 RepID=UPI002357AED9|nr:mandelate racemase/muconate lactonizing enzyme family protein [Desulforamulus ruminis]